MFAFKCYVRHYTKELDGRHVVGWCKLKPVLQAPGFKLVLERVLVSNPHGAQGESMVPPYTRGRISLSHGG